MKGLPSCLNIEFTYYAIANIFKAMETGEVGFEDLTEDEQYRILDEYWVLVADALNSIHKKHYNVTIF
jgi:hypothetical protein